MPCRFKYKQVEPESFGLSATDILLAEDKELNRYVSLKHLAPYSKRKLDSRDADLSKKRKKLRSAIRQRMHEEELASGRKKHERDSVEISAAHESGEMDVAEENEAAENVAGEKKRRRRKKKNVSALLQANDAHDDNDDRAEDIAEENATEETLPRGGATEETADDVHESESESIDKQQEQVNKDKKKRKKQRGKGKKVESNKTSKEDNTAKRLALYK